jgi:serine/threonine protein kinase
MDGVMHAFCGSQFSSRFLREARAIASRNHPNICTLFDVGQDYLVMEYVDGTPPRGPSKAAHEKGIIIAT